MSRDESRPTVGAFVITFRRPRHLRSTLEAVLAQSRPPEMVVVVDNAAQPECEEIATSFADRGVVYRAMPDNLGSSGGARAGVRACTEAGHSWAWWIDDDDPPRVPDELERLLRLATGDPAIAAAGAFGLRWDWSRGVALRVPNEELRGRVELDVLSGNAHMLLRTSVTEEIEPDPDLFFGIEDWEFCLRLRRAGYHVVTEGELMYRYRQLSDRVDFEPVVALRPPDDPDRLWRRYYTTRNTIYTLRAVFDRPDLARRHVLRALARVATSWLRGPLYGARFSAIQVRAIADAYRRRLGRTVEPKAKRLAPPPVPDRRPAKAAPDPSSATDHALRFSIILPTRDRDALLPRSLDSALGQDHDDFEVVVVDDGSEDGTAAYLATRDDPHLTVVTNPRPLGAAAARNRGVERSRGRWLVFLDDDDVFDSRLLRSLQGRLAEAPPEVGFAWCGVRRLAIGSDGSTRVVAQSAWQPSFPDRRQAYLGILQRRDVGTSCGLTVRRSTFEEVDGFDEDLPCAEDTDLLIRLAQCSDFVVVPEVLVDIHQHAGPRLTVYDARMAAAWERIAAKHREALVEDPEVCAAVEYKLGWLQHWAGDRKRGRQHLLRALRARPGRIKTWAALLLFEILGTRGAEIHRRLSRRLSQWRTRGGTA